MTITRLLLLSAITISFVAKANTTAFDGKWVGEGAANTQCSSKATISFIIKNGEISEFALEGPRGAATDGTGIVKDDGSIDIADNRLKLTGNLMLQAGEFLGKVETLCGPREFKGSKQG